MPDAAVVAAARAGDRRALERLIETYLPLAYNVLGRASDGRHTLDDVVAQVMLRALDGLPELANPAQFRSSLLAIAVRRIQAPVGAQPLSAVTWVAVEEPTDFVDLTIRQLELSGQRREAVEATRWLGEEREVLALWWLEGAGKLAREELAQACGLSAPQAAVRVAQVEERLEAARSVVRALAASPRCVELTALVWTWDGRPSGRSGPRVAHHVQECPQCRLSTTDLVPADRLLRGFALVTPPPELASRLLAMRALPPLPGPVKRLALPGPGRPLALPGPGRPLALPGPGRPLALSGPGRPLALSGPGRPLALSGSTKQLAFSATGPGLALARPRTRLVMAPVLGMAVAVLVGAAVVYLSVRPEHPTLPTAVRIASGASSIPAIRPLSVSPAAGPATPTTPAVVKSTATRRPPAPPQVTPPQGSAPLRASQVAAPVRSPVRPPVAPAPFLGRHALRSVVLPDHYVREVDDLSFLARVGADSSIGARSEATFTIQPGLADASCYSFVDSDGRYLRHFQFRVRLDYDDGSAIFQQDVTFCVQPGTVRGSFFLQSYNYPDRFVHFRGNSELWLDPIDSSQEFLGTASFTAVAPWV